MLPELLIILFLIVLNGLFSMAETAVISSRKARLRHEAERGDAKSRLVLETADKPSDFLSTIQVAITLIGILTGALGGATVAEALESALAGIPWLQGAAGPISVGIVVLVTTFISVVVGELVPKNLALSRPETIAAALIRPMLLLSVVFRPLVHLFSATTRGLISLTGISAAEEPEVTEEEVKVMIAQGTESGVFDDREREMVEGVLGLEDRRVTSLMTPRTEVVCIDRNDNEDMIRDTVIENSRFAWLPVVDGDLDRIVGMVETTEILSAMARGSFSGIGEHLANPLFVPESLSALQAVSSLKQAGTRTALIVDEYGGITGLVAFSDLVESILGEAASSSGEEPSLVMRENGSWLVDGSIGVDRFVRELGLDTSLLGEGDYETLAGLVLDRMGAIPKAGDTCSWESCSIEVVDMDGNRIDKVIVTIHPKPDSGTAADEGL